jgi:hypothetical protein
MAKELQIKESVIAAKIYEVRGKRVMLSNDLAELYEVDTRVLNQQVTRNIKRFPDRYLFKLTMEEYREALRSQNVILNRGEHSKYPPYAFTEHGILMLSSILRSERAEKVNIIIIDTFVKLRELLSTHKELLHKMDEIERNVSSHDHQIVVLFEQLKRLLADKETREQQANRKRIGFKKEE